MATCLVRGARHRHRGFQFEATTPEVLRLAAELSEHPFEHTRLFQALYEDNGLAYLRLLGRLLERLRHVAGRRASVWTYLTRADLEAADVHPGRPTTSSTSFGRPAKPTSPP